MHELSFTCRGLYIYSSIFSSILIFLQGKEQARDVHLHKPTSKKESNIISYNEAGMI